MALRKQVHLQLSDELDAALDEAARRRGESRSTIVRQLIREHLDPSTRREAPPITQSSLPKVRA